MAQVPGTSPPPRVSHQWRAHNSETPPSKPIGLSRETLEGQETGRSEE
jgi:hypothetical protein